MLHRVLHRILQSISANLCLKIDVIRPKITALYMFFLPLHKNKSLKISLIYFFMCDVCRCPN